MANNTIEVGTVWLCNGGKSATSGTTFTMTGFKDESGNSGNPNLGDTILVSVGIPSSSVTVSQIQDNLGNSYVKYSSAVSGSLDIELWYCLSVAVTGSFTITVTLSATGTLASGGAGAYKSINQAAWTATTTVSGNSATATTGSQSYAQSTNTMVVLAFACDGSATVSPALGTFRGGKQQVGISAGIQDTFGNPSPATASVGFGATVNWVGIWFEAKGYINPPSGSGPVLNWKQDTDSGNNTTTTTLTITATGAQSVSAGDLIVAMYRSNVKTGAVITVSDNKNAGNYQQAYLQNEGGTNLGQIACFYMPNSVAVAAGQLAVTVVTTTAALIYLGVLVYHGIAAANPLDTVSSRAYAGVTGTTNQPTSNSVTPAGSNELAIGQFSVPTGQTFSTTWEGLGFTTELTDHIGSTIFAHCHVADRILPDTAAISYQLASDNNNASANSGWIMGLALFLPPVVGDTVALTGKWQLQ